MVTVLFDDFTGSSVDTTKWRVYDRISDQINGEVNCVVPANVSVSSGTLKIIGKFEDHTCGDTLQAPQVENYTSGHIHARPLFLYGTVDVRAKIAGGTGLWPCIWMLGYKWQPTQPYTASTPDNNGPNDGWCEVDIAEFMNGHRTLVNNALHLTTNNRTGSGEKSLPFDATTRFMVYRLVWTATTLTWLVDAEDGVGFRTLTSMSGTAGVDIPNVPMFLIINMAVGGAGGGTPNSATFPQTMEVDYALITGGLVTTASILLDPGSATLPDGSTNNAPPALSRVKGTGTGSLSSVTFTTLASFDPTTPNHLWWAFTMPVNYASGPALRVHWGANATSGSVVWGAQIGAITPTDADTPFEHNMATGTSVTTAANTTEAKRLVESVISFANLDSLAAGDLILVHLYRDAANGSDTCTVTGDVLAATLEYVTT